MPQKRLKPSMRERKRYLLLEGKVSKKDIETIILDYIGILGYAKAGVSFVKKNVLAVNRGSLNEIRAAFSVSPLNIKVKKVSGTLKGLGK